MFPEFENKVNLLVEVVIVLVYKIIVRKTSIFDWFYHGIILPVVFMSNF